MTLERPLRATYQGRSRSRATRWSDCTKSLAFSRPETHNSLSERPLAATQRGRSRSLERPVQSDREKSLAILVPGDKKSLSERPLAATQRGRSRSLERLVGATSRGRSAPIICSISILLKGLLVISLCTFYISKTYVLNIFCSHQRQIIFYLLIY